MAKFYIREWAGISGDRQAPAGIVKEPAPLDFGSGHQESGAFSAGTTLLEWSTDAICSWTLIQVNDSTKIATTNHVRYPADSRGFVSVSPGMKISVISNS